MIGCMFDVLPQIYHKILKISHLGMQHTFQLAAIAAIPKVRNLMMSEFWLGDRSGI